MRERILWQTAALVCGFIIDFFVGDPYSIPHPVVAIGKWISFFDRKLRRGNSNPKDVGRGALTVILVALLSTLPPALLLDLAWHLHPILYFVLNSVMCWQILAARQLFREGKKVQRALEAGDTSAAALQCYVEDLENSFVMKDLRKYKDEPLFLENFDRMFKEYPEMVRDIMNSMFVIDGAPVKPLLSKILPQVRKIGFLNILLDVRGALKAL